MAAEARVSIATVSRVINGNRRVSPDLRSRVLSAMDRLGYQGFVGLEYVPKPDTLKSLGWIKEYGCQMA